MLREVKYRLGPTGMYTITVSSANYPPGNASIRLIKNEIQAAYFFRAMI